MSAMTVNSFPSMRNWNSPRAWALAIIVLLHLGFFLGADQWPDSRTIDQIYRPGSATTAAPAGTRQTTPVKTDRYRGRQRSRSPTSSRRSLRRRVRSSFRWSRPTRGPVITRRAHAAE